MFVAHSVCRHEQEKSHGASKNSELRRRLKQLEEENEEMSDNRLKLIGKSFRFCLKENKTNIVDTLLPVMDVKVT